MRTRETIEAQSSAIKPTPKAEKKYRPGQHPNSRANLVAPWTPETVPRSAGRPKRDMSQVIAREVFEKNPELIYNACVEQLRRGGAFAYQVYSDRAYGKLKEVRETGLEYNEIPDADLAKRIAQLERDLGLARAIDEAGRAGIAQAGSQEADGEAQDSHVLPGNGTTEA